MPEDLAPSTVLAVAVSVVVIVGVAYGAARAAAAIGQPRIVGAMAAGLVVGTAVFSLPESVLPEPAADDLDLLGQAALAAFLFVVGASIVPARLRGRLNHLAGVTVAVSAGCGAVGVALATALDGPRWHPAAVGATAFTLAVTAAVTVNGVPVTARILAERDRLSTRLGGFAMAAATTVTCVSIVTLAGATALERGGLGPAAAAVAVAFVGGVVALALLAATAVDRAAASVGGRGGTAVRRAAAGALAVAALGACSIAADALVESVVVGALLFGIALPPGSRLREWGVRLAPAVTLIPVPIYLASSARSADLVHIGLDALPAIGLLLAAILVGKAGLAALAGYSGHLAGREAVAFGALMSCGGVMTIAVAENAARAGLITSTLHGALVVCGMLTTIATGPVLDRALRLGRHRGKDRAPRALPQRGARRRPAAVVERGVPSRRAPSPSPASTRRAPRRR